MSKYQEILSEDQEQLLEQIELESAEQYELTVQNYKKIVKAGLARWVEEFQADRIKMNTIDDLEKLMKLDLMLQKKEV